MMYYTFATRDPQGWKTWGGYGYTGYGVASSRFLTLEECQEQARWPKKPYVIHKVENGKSCLIENTRKANAT